MNSTQPSICYAIGKRSNGKYGILWDYFDTKGEKMQATMAEYGSVVATGRGWVQTTDFKSTQGNLPIDGSNPDYSHDIIVYTFQMSLNYTSNIGGTYFMYIPI